MAIQHRRGNYADLDISRLVQGEPFVTLDKVDGNYYVGIAIAPNNVVRLASWDDLTTIKVDCEQARDDAQASALAASTSETNAGNSALDSEAWAVGEKNGVPVPNTDPRYNNNSEYYAGLSQTYWGYIDAAVQHIIPSVSIDYTTGELMYSGTQLMFWIDQSTGYLMWNV